MIFQDPSAASGSDVVGMLNSVGGIPLLGAFILVVGMFLKFLSDERKDRAAERESFLSSIERIESRFENAMGKR